jgi:hypothetical protein
LITKTEKTPSSQATHLDKITRFLIKIGIGYHISEEYYDSFLDGVLIENGKLKINPKKLISVGDVLHEAGHLACIPSNLRPRANDDISKSVGEEYTCEMAVIAWTVAAAIHLDIPLVEVFNKGGYKGEGEWILGQYNSKVYIGLPLLQWLGLAAYEDELIENEILPYPVMLRWALE